MTNIELRCTVAYEAIKILLGKESAGTAIMEYIADRIKDGDITFEEGKDIFEKIVGER